MLEAGARSGTEPSPDGTHGPRRRGSMREVFAAFLKLGCTAFGGPLTHLCYSKNEFVKRRCWLDETTFADTVAFCQFNLAAR